MKFTAVSTSPNFTNPDAFGGNFSVQDMFELIGKKDQTCTFTNSHGIDVPYTSRCISSRFYNLSVIVPGHTFRKLTDNKKTARNYFPILIHLGPKEGSGIDISKALEICVFTIWWQPKDKEITVGMRPMYLAQPNYPAENGKNGKPTGYWAGVECNTYHIDNSQQIGVCAGSHTAPWPKVNPVAIPFPDTINQY